MATVLKVEGMSCNHCKAAVEKALQQVSGVEGVRVDLEQKQVEVDGPASRDLLVKAVEDAGYDVVE